ncbi:hypothetical protein PCASD_04014 [Puccinia coronata f. sp. avenae]|uniref:Uncharacterized protein n=1 Tax=Puccinia coronata f. sp. avenae TaxID=200324 RepID=A0A2N5V5I2_9BASI|nr:hypothetical protein PCASD_04014 [Puccinia coronata f. sp. avenae]
MGLTFLFLLIAHIHLHLSLPTPEVGILSSIADVSRLGQDAIKACRLIPSPSPRLETSFSHRATSLIAAVRPIHQTITSGPRGTPREENCAINRPQSFYAISKLFFQEYIGWPTEIFSKYARNTLMTSISVKGDDGTPLAEYMAERQAKMENNLINKLYESLFVEQAGLADVKYNKESDHLIRFPNKEYNTSVLFGYFKQILGEQELERRRSVLLLQAKQRTLQEEWSNQVTKLTQRFGYDAEKLKEYSKVLRMGDYFPGFVNQPGMGKNLGRLQALKEKRPHLHDAFKSALGDDEYERRVKVMTVMDYVKSPDITDRTVSDWLEQGLAVPQMCQIIDCTRYDTLLHGTRPWRQNPAEYELVWPLFEHLKMQETLEEKKIIQFLSVEDELKYEALKREIPKKHDIIQTPVDEPEKKSWWTKILDLLKRLLSRTT